MEYFPIKNYEEFKELFGSKESRRNKILLAQWRNKDFFKRFIVDKESNFTLTNVESLSNEILWHLSIECFSLMIDSINNRSNDSYGSFELCGKTFYSPVVELDNFNGVCIDGDINAIRYKNISDGKIYKMKAAKFLQSKILDYMNIPFVSEQLKIFMLEQFSTRWKLFANEKVGVETELVVDDDFDTIYEDRYYSGDFGSCMKNKGFGDFYNRCNAKAASLWKKDSIGEKGCMIARCVIFNEVHLVDEPDKIYRLAERQYSENGDNVLKHLLINKLIDGGYIDGYKQIDADCHSPKAFVLNDGTAFDNDIYIEIDVCDICDYDVPYFDTFKWFNNKTCMAYNDSSYHYDYELESVDGNLVDEDDYNYDSWHDVSTLNNLVNVHYNGRTYTCDEERLDDFYWIESLQEYWHSDNVKYCDHCNAYFHEDDALYLECTDEYYCCEDCRDKALQNYHNRNTTYDTYNEEDTDDITYLVNIDCWKHYITVKNIKELMDSGRNIKIPYTTIEELKYSNDSYYRVNSIIKMYYSDFKFAC